MKGKRHTEEARRRISEALKGRKISEETRRRISDSNRGRKVSEETRRRMSEASKGKKLSEETRRRIGEASKGKKLSEAARRRIGEANRRRKVSEETRRKMSESGKGKKLSEETRRRMSEIKMGVPMESELTKAGPTNHKSTVGTLRDPMGRKWPFRNLSHFVRTHPELFDPDDLVPRNERKPEKCRATGGLYGLFGRGKYVPGSWKGWMVVSREENGEDLLARNITAETSFRND